jgi:acetylornithine deacetylase/succinyl-diaminopimelate desuccinylase-like protein
MKQTPLDYVVERRKEFEESLCELLRIPSISTAPDRESDVAQAAAWLVEWLLSVGMDRAGIMPTSGHPVVFGEWKGASDAAPTLLVYGHYDVQPTDPDEEWRTKPFEPTVRDGNLYARGASDNKGQLFTHLAATEAFFKTIGQPPLNLKFMFEGEEEIGSPNLDGFVKENADLLACDVALISDTSMVDAETPALVRGVRGLAYMEVIVHGPRNDLHSGSYGGAVHNPIQVMAEMVAALHDSDGRVTIPGFYDKVRPLSDRERTELERIPFDETAFLEQEVGAPALWKGETGYTPLERIGARPTLEIHGIGGGFTGEGSKTVIPAKAWAKVSMRLVPDQDPREIAEMFEKHIVELAPSTVNVEVRRHGLADAAVIDVGDPAMQTAVHALKESFGAEPVFVRAGGTLPVVALLGNILHAPVIMMGFGLPDDNLHAPNEKMSLDNFHKGIQASIHFMQELAGQK